MRKAIDSTLIFLCGAGLVFALACTRKSTSGRKPNAAQDVVPGSEKQTETEESLKQLYTCAEVEIAHTGGERINLRSGAGSGFEKSGSALEGERFLVKSFKRDGEWMIHDQEAGRRSPLWYEVQKVDASTTAWITAVFTNCLR